MLEMGAGLFVADFGRGLRKGSLEEKQRNDYLKEAYRILQPFGLLLVAEPAKVEKQKELEGAIKEAGFKVLEAYQRASFSCMLAVKV